ncbi:hypothetical protein ACFLIM_48200 [Nonomuraea sp. M3C6]|uniref:Uncharacterized protein n=1 Tax=Nonomuraea marmarensis TaxID=3351344 RepID=A0ABW7AV95_9ACTN
MRLRSTDLGAFRDGIASDELANPGCTPSVPSKVWPVAKPDYPGAYLAQLAGPFRASGACHISSNDHGENQSTPAPART